MNMNARYISFRTFRKSGVKVDTPVWFASVNTETHYLFSAAKAGKVKRVRNSPVSQIAACDARGGSLARWHESDAFIVIDKAESTLAYELLEQKYGWKMKVINFLSRLSGRIQSRVVIRLEMREIKASTA